ncbi:Disulfide bond formation protein DsbB [Aliiroseovarius sediminilitoris]|uniref:Disulfide bond formation protein DsbB n=1 Tax=Aliiroseovarius sediminilitoris TaxID=1173584 RepID=A0A1I0PPM3_9RHOB|nr:disulfide bond formation protein B [Aliiroseovarius sediminilitoris]SEW16225.1 Disulfide bond formation protein DsbB [Aliiroseovarius sediminilitoris]
MRFLDRFTANQLIAFAAISSALILGGAFVFQALGYAPCKLCLWQRWPHAAAIVIGGVALSTKQKALAWLGALAAATTSAIGFFHSGVERKLWDGPSSCTGSGVADMSVDDLLSKINDAPLIRCDEIPWDLFGVTMANLNAVGALVLAIIWVVAATRKT